MNTLSLCDALLQRGQELLRLQQPRAASRLLAPLLALDHPRYSFQAHRALAEWADEQQLLRRARQHWRAAWKLQPNNAEVCYRYAMALDADAHVPSARAWAMIRRAVRLDRTAARFWVLYGQIAQRMDQDHRAVRAYRRVLQDRTATPATLVEALTGLQTLGWPEEARQGLTKARFQHPHDPSLRRLGEEWQWQEAQTTQQNNAEPTLLPFPTDRSETGTHVRHDGYSVAKPHLFRLPHERRPKYRGS